MHKAEILRAAPACAAAAFLSPKERVGIAMEKKKRVSFGMFLVTIGIVYGDIGTSPLYVMKSILKGNGGIAHVKRGLYPRCALAHHLDDHAAHDRQVCAHRHACGQ